MDLKKVENKLNNFKKIHSKVINDKNIIQIDIIKQNSLLTHYLSNSLLNQYLILAIKQQYQIKNTLISHNPKTNNNWLTKLSKVFLKPKQLWIYLTEEQKYQTDSYSRYETHILQTLKQKNIDFITIGSRAEQFCLNNNLNVVYSLDLKQTNLDLSWKLTEIIKLLFSQQNYQSLCFVINSNKNKNKHFTILPLSEFDIVSLSEKELKHQTINISKFKIYPNIDQYLNIQVDSFIKNSIESLLVESSFYKAKNELIRINKIINEVDEEIQKLNKKIIRIKREKEIEEIVLLVSANKRFAL
ncbi:MSC_0622 family F1-like ATPase gamma subunit [Mycoplasma putrefaciens]|uniref:ATP synthase gamma chain n=1 Tax=Mycoplasma putrefaciens Mput9231 TaxID=1292033 RepID=M9WHF6_9MOLU|nr:hypothetical protein [Mycoplasma putrefaciens]AGJ90819.1 Hypothetical protein MPUT9231_4090 [Mycoplasma putrefaciens Mput9231]